MSPLLSVFADASLKGSIVLVMAALVARSMDRQSAAARHAVWTFAIVAQLALPVLALGLPSWRVPVLPAPTTVSISTSIPRAPSARVTLTPPASASSVPVSPVIRRPSLLELTALVWLVGIALVLGRLAFGVMTVGWIARRATRVHDGQWLTLFRRVVAGLGIRRPIRLLQGSRLTIPVTWGVRRPVVLLPPGADAWPVELRQFVLMHELAHVKRFDALTQYVGQVALALFWMNPLVWMAVRRMQRERERACDDYVLRDGGRASTYAQGLLAMVRSMGSATGPAFAALAFARPSEFEGRMLAILNPHLQRRALGARGTLVAGVMGLLVIPMAMFQPVARHRAEVTPRPLPVVAIMGLFLEMPGPSIAEAELSSTPSPMEDDTTMAPEAEEAQIDIRPEAWLQPESHVVEWDGEDSVPRSRADGTPISISADQSNIFVILGDSSHRISIHREGDLECSRNTSTKEVVLLAPGSEFTIVQYRGDSTWRVVMHSDCRGQVERTWAIGGQSRPYGDEAREWLRSTMELLDRNGIHFAMTEPTPPPPPSMAPLAALPTQVQRQWRGQARPQSVTNEWAATKRWPSGVLPSELDRVIVEARNEQAAAQPQRSSMDGQQARPGVQAVALIDQEEVVALLKGLGEIGRQFFVVRASMTMEEIVAQLNARSSVN